MRPLISALIIFLILAAHSVYPCNADDPSIYGTHTIAFDETLETLDDADGADAFGHVLDHTDSPYYSITDYYEMQPTDELHIIPWFATYQQTTEYTCGAASALMVLNHFGNHDYNELQIAKMAEAHQTKGISVEGLAGFFSEIGYDVEFHADTDKMFESVDEARDYFLDKIDAGIPVMVSWVDWAGHWQTVIGLDTMGSDSPYDDVLIFADSYDVTDHYQDGYYIFPLGRFFYMWREGPCTEKLIPYEQAFVTARPSDY